MILTEENWSPEREICLNTTFFPLDPTQIGLGSNPSLRTLSFSPRWVKIMQSHTAKENQRLYSSTARASWIQNLHHSTGRLLCKAGCMQIWHDSHISAEGKKQRVRYLCYLVLKWSNVSEGLRKTMQIPVTIAHLRTDNRCRYLRNTKQ